MYIGKLQTTDPVFTHPDSDIPFLPTSSENGVNTWAWKVLYDTVLDVNFSVAETSFIGALTVDITAKSVRQLQIFVDGELCHTSKRYAFDGTTVFPVNADGSDITIRICADVNSIDLGEISALGMYEDGAPFIWPVPKSLEQGEGSVRLSEITTANGDADELAAADFLAARLGETFSEPYCDGGVPVTFIKLDSPDYDGERYTVDISEDGVVITAASRIALIYGADALMQTDSIDGFPICTVDDKPSRPFRGFHIGLPAKEQMEFTKRLMTYVLIPLRYNTLIVEFAGGMRFDKRPEIAEGVLRAAENHKNGIQPEMPHSGMVAGGNVLEKDDVRELVSFVKELGIEFVPEVQSLGHVQFMTYAYPEIAEMPDTKEDVKDTRIEDARPVDFYPHCYCPENPKSYEIIYDIIDEIVEVTQPNYVHIGHDEVYHIGLCPRCRHKPQHELFLNDINKLYSYITKKGLKVMMWSDHLHALSKHTVPTAPAADLVPKDILMLDFTWYFHLNDDIETDLLEKGFKVAVGNLYSSHFPRFESRMARDGMVGGQISCWVATTEKELADNGKFWDASLVSQMLWNSNTYDSRLLSTYNSIIGAVIQPTMREKIRGALSPFGLYDASFGITGNAAPAALAAVCDAAVIDDASFEIGMKAKTVVFNHATVYGMPRIPWKELKTVGTYTVTYSDGESVDIPVRYGAEIMCYNTLYADPMPHQIYRHQGYVGTWYTDPAIEAKAPDGSDVCIRGFVWDNPFPQKTVTSISYKKAEDSYAQLILESINIVCE